MRSSSAIPLNTPNLDQGRWLDRLGVKILALLQIDGAIGAFLKLAVKAGQEGVARIERGFKRHSAVGIVLPLQGKAADVAILPAAGQLLTQTLIERCLADVVLLCRP